MNSKRVTERLQRKQRLTARWQVIPEDSSSREKQTKMHFYGRNKQRCFFMWKANRQVTLSAFLTLYCNTRTLADCGMALRKNSGPCPWWSLQNKHNIWSQRCHAKVGQLTLANISREDICLKLDPYACRTAQTTQTCSSSSRRSSPFEQLAQTEKQYSKIGLPLTCSRVRLHVWTSAGHRPSAEKKRFLD